MKTDLSVIFSLLSPDDHMHSMLCRAYEDIQMELAPPTPESIPPTEHLSEEDQRRDHPQHSSKSSKRKKSNGPPRGDGGTRAKEEEKDLEEKEMRNAQEAEIKEQRKLYM